MKSGVGACVALILFVVAFIAFMLAPLLMVAVVAGGMWSLERWGKRSKRGVGVNPPKPVVTQVAGHPGEPSEGHAAYGFGARAGESL